MIHFNSLKSKKIIKRLDYGVYLVDVVEHSSGYLVVLYNKYNFSLGMYSEYKYKKSALKYSDKIYYEYNSK